MKMRFSAAIYAVVILSGFILVERASAQEVPYGFYRAPGDKAVPVYAVGLGYVPESQFHGYGKSSMLEFGANWSFGYFRDVIGGDVDLKAEYTSIMFMDSADIDLPNQAAILALNAGCTWNYDFGTVLQVRARPGVYPDVVDAFDSDTLLMPVSCVAVHPFRSDLSGIFGMEVRPSYEMKIMPVYGVLWDIDDSMRLEACMPQSRFVYFLDEQWRGYLGLDWQNTTFDFRSNASDNRDEMTMEDFRLYTGAACMTAYQLQFAGEFGLVFNRSIEFNEEVPNIDRKIDIDSGMFVRFGVAGGF